jgi:hypothetical protein
MTVLYAKTACHSIEYQRWLNDRSRPIAGLHFCRFSIFEVSDNSGKGDGVMFGRLARNTGARQLPTCSQPVHFLLTLAVVLGRNQIPHHDRITAVYGCQII